MTERLFGRTVIAEIGVEGQIRRWDGLQINGNVKKERRTSANTADIEIYNLSKDSIVAAKSSGAVLRLYAGYSIPRLLFTGTINPGGAVLEKQGPDRILRVSAKDGGYEYLRARVNKTFKRGVTWREVFDELAAVTGLPLGTVRVPPGRTRRPIVLEGSVEDVMQRLADSTRSEVSIVNSAWQVLPIGEPAPDQAIVVSSRRLFNLVGSPSPQDQGMKIKALLDARYNPGRRIVLESEDYEGDYRIISVDHEFDSGHGAAFFSTMFAEPL